MATVRRKRKRTVATRKRIRHAIDDEFEIADWMTTAPDDDKPGETTK